MSGFVEIYVSLWKPDENTEPKSLTIDINMDEERLEEVNSRLEEVLKNYNNADVDESQYSQSIVLENLRGLLDEGLIRDASCEELGISTVEELEQKLDSGKVEEFPIR